MPKFNVIIADDEPIARRILRNMLATHSDINIIDETDTLGKTMESVWKNSPDLIFLDVQFQDDTCFTITNGISELSKRPEIIFTTAYNNFAIDAFKLKAIDYLLKPVSQLDLNEALNHFRMRYNNNKTTGVPAEVLHFLNNLDQYRINIKTRTADYLLKSYEIGYLHSEGSYSDFFLINGRSIAASGNLKKYEALLPEDSFFRISRQNIININYLSSIKNKERKCVISINGHEIELEISRTRINDFKKMLSKKYNANI